MFLKFQNGYIILNTLHIFPLSWKLAHVVPVFKGAGDKSQPSNYMPISLISVVGKVLECLLNQSLLEYLESNNPPTYLESNSYAQYGFHHARSAGDLLSLLTGHLSFVLEKRGEAFVVALDISKAFDRIWHNGLYTSWSPMVLLALTVKSSPIF